MPLSDLVKYIPVQEQAISQLSVLDPKGEDSVEWIPFRDSLWGKPLETFLVEEETVERDDDPIKAVPIHPPVTRSVATVHPTAFLPWDLRSQKILVRSEYKEAEEAALLANESSFQIFVVSGQPGIGPPSPPHRLQNLTFDQENLFFYFTSSCAASRSSSPQYFRILLPPQFFSTRAVSPSSVNTRTTACIPRYISHQANTSTGYGFLSTWVRTSGNLPKSSDTARHSSPFVRCPIVPKIRPRGSTNSEREDST